MYLSAFDERVAASSTACYASDFAVGVFIMDTHTIQSISSRAGVPITSSPHRCRGCSGIQHRWTLLGKARLTGSSGGRAQWRLASTRPT
jgi:hypothetical protein